MKKHAANVAVSGVAGTIALVIATAIANEAQTLLGLDLEAGALALYLLPFVAAAGLIFHQLIKLEEKRLLDDIGDALGGLDLSALFGGVTEISGTPTAAGGVRRDFTVEPDGPLSPAPPLPDGPASPPPPPAP